MTEKEKNEIKEEENEIIDEADEVNDVESDNDTGDTLTPSEESEETTEDESSEDIEEDVVEEEVPEVEDVPQEKMLTQSQVNELVGRARQEGRESAMKELLERYGVSNDTELNDVFGKGQIYDDLNGEFESQGNSYKAALAENALLKSHILPERWEDVKLILSGKGLDVNSENIESLIMTHPEWRGENGAVNGVENKMLTPDAAENMVKNRAVNNGSNTSPLKITKLGNEPGPEHTDSEEETVKKLFGF